AVDGNLTIALALGIAAGHQLGDVAITHIVHGQQGQPADRAVLVLTLDPEVHPGDRLDPRAHGRPVELDQTAHVALVGHRHGRHALHGDRLDERLDSDQAVYQG